MFNSLQFLNIHLYTTITCYTNYIIFNNTMKNKTLTKNMPYVKWNAIPPVKGPDSQGVTYGNNKKNTSVHKKPLGKNKRVL